MFLFLFCDYHLRQPISNGSGRFRVFRKKRLTFCAARIAGECMRRPNDGIVDCIGVGKMRIVGRHKD